MKTEKSLHGHLLVASPDLLDPNFHRTVVLIVEHSAQGTLGLVLNRPSDMQIKDLWEKIGDSPCESVQPLHFGGPVDGPLMAVHAHESLADSTVLPGLYFSMQKHHLDELISKPDDSYRFFVGNAGWSAGQLESEMQEGSWLTAPASVELVLYNGDDLWDKVRAQIVKSSLIDRLGIKHAPGDPRMN